MFALTLASKPCSQATNMLYLSFGVLFLACGKQPDCIFEIDEDQTIAGFVANGFGIAVVPNMPILTNMHLKVIHITEANWERRFYVAYLKNRYRTPLAEQFLSYVKSHALI